MKEALKAIQDWCHLETERDKINDQLIKKLEDIIENQGKIIKVLDEEINILKSRVSALEEKSAN